MEVTVSRRRLLVLASTAALAAAAPPASAEQAAEPRTVTATGLGIARVQPADRHDNASIRRAVQGALKKALPRALADASGDARALAAGTGLTLGEIVAVSETPPSPFGFYDDANGSFGPGRYCGRLRVSVLRRIDGRRRRVVRTRRVCRFPTTVTKSVSITFAASPRQ